MKYRFSEVNCHPQCQQCNVFLNWNYLKYTMYMINEYWLEKTQEMINDKTTKEEHISLIGRGSRLCQKIEDVDVVSVLVTIAVGL